MLGWAWPTVEAADVRSSVSQDGGVSLVSPDAWRIESGLLCSELRRLVSFRNIAIPIPSAAAKATKYQQGGKAQHKDQRASGGKQKSHKAATKRKLVHRDSRMALFRHGAPHVELIIPPIQQRVQEATRSALRVIFFVLFPIK